MRVLGVDPGQTGALALMSADGLLAVEDMPVVDGRVNPDELARLVEDWYPSVAAVEAVHSMPRQGVASSFKFGAGYGMVLGVLAALHVARLNPTPTQWTRAFNLTSDKEGHRRRAIELWPGQAARFARKLDDGRADAALIAQWGYERHSRERLAV